MERGASMKFLLRCSMPFALLLSLVTVSLAFASGPTMKLKGSLLPWSDGLFGAVVVDADRGVAYMGSLDPARGVAVIDMRNRAHPVLSMDLGPPPNDPGNLSTSIDVDLVGRYLLVVHHQELGRTSFAGVSVYDISANPFHPTLLRRIPVPGDCGLESAELDPEVESGRPYAYCNAHCIINGGMYTVNILTGEVLSRYISSEPLNCPPFPCVEENLPHEGFVQRHPRSGRVLVYIGYWDSGLRIADVTDPRNPVEVGSFDYGAGTPFQKAHGAVATASGNWVYVGDEFGDGAPPGGGVHIFDAHSCDGTAYCTPTLVGFWHAEGQPVVDPNPGDFFSDFAFDAHNMSPRGENTLLLGNYGYGIRLVDTSIKAHPEQISSYLPDSTKFPWAPLTWVALFGSDDLVYASDIHLGFFIVKVKGEGGANEAMAFRISSGASGSGTHRFTFSTKRDGPISLTMFDVAGRRVALVNGGYAATGSHTLIWNGLSTNGRRAPSGLYFARVSTPEGQESGKVVHLAP